MIQAQISYRNQSFQNELIQVVTSDQSLSSERSRKRGTSSFPYGIVHVDWLDRSAVSCFRTIGTDVFTALSLQNENYCMCKGQA